MKKYLLKFKLIGNVVYIMKTNGLFTLIEAVTPNKTLIILLILIQKNLLNTQVS